MAFNNVRSLPGVTAACVGLLISVSACGSDSTGPSNVSAEAALQSLALGMGAAGLTSPGDVSTDASNGEIARLLGQINVSIDGTTQSMFALGTRQTFPAGTCMEDLFTFPSIPPDNTECTLPPSGLSVFLWQSHSATALPDRMIIISADAGTSNFSFMDNFNQSAVVFPAFAIYMQGMNSFWSSLSGSLTSQVAATSQSCGLTLPPYAKAATCSIATFDEQGSITFEEFSDNGSTGRHLTVTIPQQTLHGVWLDITETQKVGTPWDYNRVLGSFGR